MGATRASFTLILLLFFFFLDLAGSSAMHEPKKTPNKPCKELKLFFHDILYNGKNADNATSTIVAGPEGSNRTILEPKNNHFGNVIVINDPITLDNNLHSPPVGHAQGMYMYDVKDTFSAWMAFTIVLNSTEHQGTISVMGTDPILEKTRDISVVGGTGDFAMARGIATITTGSFEGEIYFRIRIDIKLYDCWH